MKQKTKPKQKKQQKKQQKKSATKKKKKKKTKKDKDGPPPAPPTVVPLNESEYSPETPKIFEVKYRDAEEDYEYNPITIETDKEFFNLELLNQ